MTTSSADRSDRDATSFIAARRSRAEVTHACAAADSELKVSAGKNATTPSPTCRAGSQPAPTIGAPSPAAPSADANSVSGKRFDVGSVAGEDCAAWLGDGHHERIDGRAGAGESAELGCSAGNIHADGRFDDACLQKAMGVGIATGITVQRLDEHHRRTSCSTSRSSSASNDRDV